MNVDHINFDTVAFSELIDRVCCEGHRGQGHRGDTHLFLPFVSRGHFLVEGMKKCVSPLGFLLKPAIRTTVGVGLSWKY